MISALGRTHDEVFTLWFSLSLNTLDLIFTTCRVDWSPVPAQAHNLNDGGSNPPPASKEHSNYFLL